MFANVILPDVPVDQMRGLFALLGLIANPNSKAAADFLQRLSDEKDAAIAEKHQASVHRAEAERLHAAMSGLEAQKISLAERELALSQASADLERRRSEFMATMRTIAADFAPLVKDSLRQKV
jgi:hypothetical protein